KRCRACPALRADLRAEYAVGGRETTAQRWSETAVTGPGLLGVGPSTCAHTARSMWRGSRCCSAEQGGRGGVERVRGDRMLCWAVGDASARAGPVDAEAGRDRDGDLGRQGSVAPPTSTSTDNWQRRLKATRAKSPPGRPSNWPRPSETATCAANRCANAALRVDAQLAGAPG